MVAPSTFNSSTNEGWPHVTLTLNVDIAIESTWEVLDTYILSDHKYIQITLTAPPDATQITRFKTKYGNQKFIKNLYPHVSNILKLLEGSQTTNQLDNAAAIMQRQLIKCCRISYKKTKPRNNLMPNWWTQSSDLRKKSIKCQKAKISKFK